MIKKLRSQPFYLLLLPVFFAMHGYLENFGVILFKDILLLTLYYSAATIGIFILFLLFLREKNRAALITTMLMAFFFFFGALHDFLRQELPIRFFSRYGFLLSFYSVLLVSVFFYIRRPGVKFDRFTLFCNTLLLIYLLTDIGWLIAKMIQPSKSQLSVYDFSNDNEPRICDSCSKPDIYFLVFDEYASSASLRRDYGFENGLDSFLIDRGFSVQAKSRSNYNFTPFSIASILNMSYLNGIKDPHSITADDYANCNILVRKNKVIEWLDFAGYEIVNYSVFDLAGNPSLVHQTFLPLKTRLITDGTLFSRIYRDIGWTFEEKFPFNLFNKDRLFVTRDNNNKFLQLLKNASQKKTVRPRFIYTHFYMPHPPYYFDKTGRALSEKTLGHNSDNIKESYLEYVQYVNMEIQTLIETIQSNAPSSIIIIVGDHGFREKITPNRPTISLFENMNAVYYSDRDYRILYDSMTTVNLFRAVFNKTFNQNLPLLKDSSVLLKERITP